MTEPAGFFQKHLILVVSVSLPLLLVLLFAIAMAIPRLSVEPPQHALLVSTLWYQDGRQVNGNLHFEVNEGQLYFRFNANPNPNFILPVSRLHLFEPSTGALQEINYAVPNVLEDNTLYPVVELEDIDFSGSSLSPDGYVFDNSYRGSRGFLFMNGYRYSAKIEKQGRVVKIPAINDAQFAGSPQFVAWMEEESN
ncbi:MAG: hypothetical protein P8M72_01050 [Gammaproteobacteria bacterium]|nr:hypothetical protein [Gammaproteobacteria bacterium]